MLDWNLPLKNGREVLTEIKASAALKQIPVLVLTSSDSSDDVHDAYSLNANCYLVKPTTLMGYINVARAILDFWFTTARLPENFPMYRESQARLAS